MRDNDGGRHPECGLNPVRMPRRELCEASGKVFLEGAGRRTFWNVRKEKRWLEMSHPDILMGRSATVRLNKGARLTPIVQRYGWTVKQGEPTHSVQARNLCKYIVEDNIHQRNNHAAHWWYEGSVTSSATSTICCSMWMKETWRCRCANVGWWVAVLQLLWDEVGRSTWGSAFLPVGKKSRRATIWDIAKKAHQKAKLGDGNISKYFVLNQRQEELILVDLTNLGALFETLPEERDERRRRSGR